MSVIVTAISPEKWAEYAAGVHKFCFHETLDPEDERVSFVLVGWDEKTEDPLGYVTCREHFSDAVYWQFGGAFNKSSMKNLTGFLGFRDWCKERYNRIMFYVKNDNTPMLKMALTAGFKITGVNYTKDDGMLLLHTMDFREE